MHPLCIRHVSVKWNNPPYFLWIIQHLIISQPLGNIHVPLNPTAAYSPQFIPMNSNREITSFNIHRPIKQGGQSHPSINTKIEISKHQRREGGETEEHKTNQVPFALLPSFFLFFFFYFYFFYSSFNQKRQNYTVSFLDSVLLSFYLWIEVVSNVLRNHPCESWAEKSRYLLQSDVKTASDWFLDLEFR